MSSNADGIGLAFRWKQSLNESHLAFVIANLTSTSTLQLFDLKPEVFFFERRVKIDFKGNYARP